MCWLQAGEVLPWTPTAKARRESGEPVEPGERIIRITESGRRDDGRAFARAVVEEGPGVGGLVVLVLTEGDGNE